MSGKKLAVIMGPHKSFDQIEEEYGIKFAKKELERLADLALNPDLRACLKLIVGIVKRHNVPLDRLPDLAYDVLRTIAFYAQAAKIIYTKMAEELEKP